jgi:hypothetical protein
VLICGVIQSPLAQPRKYRSNKNWDITPFQGISLTTPKGQDVPTMGIAHWPIWAFRQRGQSCYCSVWRYPVDESRKWNHPWWNSQPEYWNQ